MQTQTPPSPLCRYLGFVCRATAANVPILSGNRGTFNPFAGTQVKINTLLTGFFLRNGFGSVFQDTDVPVAAALASAELVSGQRPPCHWSPATPEAAGLSQRGAGAEPSHSLPPPVPHFSVSVVSPLGLCSAPAALLHPGAPQPFIPTPGDIAKVTLHLPSGICYFSIFPMARGASASGRSHPAITFPAPRGPGVKPSPAALQALRVPPCEAQGR